MGVLRLIRFLLSVYALMQLVHFALPYIGGPQQPWMTALARFCEPGIRLGNKLAARLFPNRQIKINIGPLGAAILCYLARMILGIFI